MANGRTEAEWLLVSCSSKMQRLFDAAKTAARSNASVLITGENGTGKGVLAKFIHESSKRAGPFVSLDLTCIPKELLESELFGVVPRYLDSRHPGKDGRVQLAHLGTLFLDEIGDMPLEQQKKLLSFCQEHTCHRVGSNQIEQIDARFIAATNRHLDAQIRSGLFREDLYFRIRDIRIHLPPLRERPEDILPLAQHYLARLSQRLNIPPPSISDELGQLLLRHAWPGNLRELESCIRMMMEDHRGVAELTPSCLPDDLREQASRSVASHSSASLITSAAVDPATPPLPSDPSYPRVVRTALIHEILTQFLLPKRVVALLQTHRGGGRTLARQIAERAGIPPVWLVDTSCERTPSSLFYRRLSRNDEVKDQETFESWLRALMRQRDSMLLICTQPRGPEALMEEVAATIRMLLSEHRGLHFLIIGGERLLRLRSHERYSWLRLLPPSSLCDVPDLSSEGNDGGDIGQVLHACGLPGSRASWLHRQTGGHPWLLYELLAQNIESEEAAAQVVQYQLRESRCLDRHLQDPEALATLDKLLGNQPVANLADPSIRRNPEKHPESRLYFDGILIPTQNGTAFRCPAVGDASVDEYSRVRKGQDSSDKREPTSCVSETGVGESTFSR